MLKMYHGFILFLCFLSGINISNAQTVVTPAATPSFMCAASTGYTTLGTIYITETDPGDFSAGTDLTYIISTPDNFEFNTSVTPVVTANAGSGITNIVVSAPTATSWTFTFDVSLASVTAPLLDSLIISNIQVIALNTGSTGNLVRSGGTAEQQDNATANAQNHGTLTSVSGMSVTADPVSQAVCVNDDPAFTVTATGEDLTYAWERYNGSSWDPAPGAYSGANTATLTANNVSLVQNGFLFRCTVSSSCGGPVITSEATLTVSNPVDVTGSTPNRTICAGANTTFGVTASNAVSYQWQENSGSGFSNISDVGVYSGTTTATLTLTAVPASMSGRTYRCVVSGACSSSENSSTRTLTVNAAPEITTHPVNRIVCVNDDPTFSVVATGPNLTYSWQRNNGSSWGMPGGGAYSNTNIATMTANDVIASQNGYLFRCTVSNACGTVTSDSAVLTVHSSGTVNFFGLATSYCRNVGLDTLEGFPSTGVFSGPGITDLGGGKGVFNPLAAGAAGSKNIVYTLGCAITKNTTLHDTTNIAFTSPAALAPSFPASSPAIDLVVELIPPSGALPGSFSGEGVTGTKFYPNLVTAGITYPVTFTFTNVNGCVSKTVKPINVTPATLGIPQLRNGGLPFCQNGSPILLSDTSVDGATPIWDADQVFYGFSGPGISSLGGNVYQFSPDSVGTYTIYYTKRIRISIGFGPGLWLPVTYASQEVTVNAPSDIDFTLPTSACRTSPPIDLNPYPNILSGGAGTGISIFSSSPGPTPTGLLSGTNNTFFNPSASEEASTVHTVRYTFVNGLGCTSVLDKQINVFPKPGLPTLYTPDGFWAAQYEEYCLGTPTKYVGAQYDMSINYNWYNNASLSVGAKISDVYYMPPQLADNQPGTYHYYVTQTIGGCVSDPLTITVKINDAAKVSVGPSQTICEGNSITLAGTSTLAVANATSLPAVWSSATMGTFSPNPDNLGAVYTPSATDIVNQYVDLKLRSDDPDGTGPCPADSAVVRMFINRAAQVYAGADATFCSNSVITLSGTRGGSTSSTTWSGGSPSSPGVGIASSGVLETTYSPTQSEKGGGTITFTLTSNDPDGPGPCPAVSDDVLITINPEVILNAGIDQTICRSTGTTVFNMNAQSHLLGSLANFAATWSGGTGTYSDNASLNTSYTVAASELPEDGATANVLKLWLTSNDPDGPAGPCAAVRDSIMLTVNSLPLVNRVIIPDTAFCTSDNFFMVSVDWSSVNAKKSEVYSDLPVTNLGLSNNFFVPNIATIGPHTIRYTVTDVNNCSNSKDTLLYVYGVPKPKISIAGYCATSPSFFDGTASDISFDPASSINAYKWNFGDFNTEEDVSSLVVDSYTYPKTLNPSAKQSYTVSLTVGTDRGCYGVDDTLITIGNIPEANFSWSKICPSDNATSFIDMSSFPSSEVGQYFWDFGDGNTQSGPGVIGVSPNLTDKNPFHKMLYGTGAYDVKFKITSQIGCIDSITRKVNILDEYKPTLSDPYARNFENSDGYWSVDGQNPSWQWGPANKPDINTGSRNVWVTNTTDPYHTSEKSYLNGPCLNFEDLTRPMVALKILSATQAQIAGSVLQSSVDGGLTWDVVGALGTGVNWYDNFGVLGNPGNQLVNQFSWTGTYTDWKIAKSNLNSLKGNSLVRLRIAFGSGQDTLNLKDGFALDSIWIGEREKILLIENFTNTSSSPATATEVNINTLINTYPNDVVAIHYHTGFPGSDPMNLRNQANPSSRVLHYGVPSVPYTVFEGNYDFGTSLGEEDVDRKSLDASKFSIKLGTKISANSVTANATIIAKEHISNDFVIHVAIVERSVFLNSTSYEWVLTRMLPSAAGTFFSQDFNKNDSTSISETWQFLPGEVYDPSQLGTIVFIQDVITKEIYQTAYILGTGGTVTSLKHESLAGKELFIYPNPANDRVVVFLGVESKEEYTYQVYDELGKIVNEGIIESGNNQLVLNTGTFAGGLYVIRIGNATEGFAYKKFVIAH